MPEMFDFSDMFAEWSSKFLRMPKGTGHYDYANGGKWVPANGAPEDIEGIVVPLTYKDLNELQFSPGGVYTRDDRKVYVQQPWVLLLDDYIRYELLDYRVLEQLPYREYAGFNVYIAKRVGTKGRDPIA